MAALFLFFFIAVYQLASAVVISPSNGSVSFCNDGVSRNFTCEVTGATLVWVSGNNSAIFGSLLTTSTPLGPYIDTHFVSAGGNMVVANATVKAFPGLNGTILECRNSDSVRAFVNFTVEASSAATSIDLQYNQYNDSADITLGGATCIQFYNISVNGNYVATITELPYTYTFRNRGTHNFEVLSVNYFGNITGVLSKTYFWELYDYTLSVIINEEKNSANFTVQGIRDNQPPINNCTITVLGSQPQSCRENLPVTFNVTLSSDTNITYNVTIINDAGVSSYINTLSGDLLVNVTHTVNNSMTITVQDTIGNPVIFALPFIVLGVLIILSIGWIVLRICWKRQCCCPRIWRSSFWLLFFCYDCCTYDPEKKESTIGLKNPNVGGDTSL